MSYFNLILMIVWASILVVPVSMISIAIWNASLNKHQRTVNEIVVDKDGNVTYR